MKSPIYKFVAAQRDSYRSDTIEITEGYDFSQYETLRTIELYDNDRFLTGNKDNLDREKPFFNIVSFRKNVATRARDLDPRDYDLTINKKSEGLETEYSVQPSPEKPVRDHAVKSETD